jgi:hypothetical protein
MLLRLLLWMLLHPLLLLQDTRLCPNSGDGSGMLLLLLLLLHV